MSRYRKPVVLRLLSLVFCVSVFSYACSAGSGLIAPEADEGYGQWKVLRTDLKKVRNDAGDTRWQWRVTARFNPEPSSPGLEPSDMTASVDAEPVPFTFETEGQLFRSATASPLSPGIHIFRIAPSPDLPVPFPTVTVRFESP